MVENWAFKNFVFVIFLIVVPDEKLTFGQEKAGIFETSIESGILEAIFPFENPEKMLKPGTDWTCILRAIQPEGSGVDHLTLRRITDDSIEFKYCFTPVGTNVQIDRILKENPKSSFEEI